ncbi:hypothetical protein DXV76_19875 [Rhodobacteraceae bacterium CCMM004]|nr:hypothetical protein DXV76_19875 [Rhodobacteraceae bacterium CCMM004]
MLQSSSLRWRLRAGTRASHERLDALVESWDVGTRAGVTRFLTMQAAALPALRADGPLKSAAAIADLADRARADLARLGATVPSPRSTGPALRPLAVDYVVAGAHLGGAVLARRWAVSADPTVRAADRYFTAPPGSALWRDVCADAAARPADGAEADATVADANTVFAIFADACFGISVNE